MKLRENSLVKRVVLDKIEEKLPIDALDEEKILAIEEGFLSDIYKKGKQELTNIGKEAESIGKKYKNLYKKVKTNKGKLASNNKALNQISEDLLSKKDLKSLFKSYVKVYTYLDKQLPGAKSKAEKNVNDYIDFIERLKSSYDSRLVVAPDTPQPVTEQDEQTQPPVSPFTKEEREDLQNEIKGFDEMLQRDLQTYPKQVFVGNGVGGALKGLEEQIAEKFAILTYEYFIQKAEKEYAERAKKKELEKIEKDKQEEIENKKDEEERQKTLNRTRASEYALDMINIYKDGLDDYKREFLNKANTKESMYDAMVYTNKLYQALIELLKLLDIAIVDTSIKNKKSSRISEFIKYVEGYPRSSLVTKTLKNVINLPSNLLEAKKQDYSALIDKMINDVKTECINFINYLETNNLFTIGFPEGLTEVQIEALKNLIIIEVPKLMVRKALMTYKEASKKQNFFLYTQQDSNTDDDMEDEEEGTFLFSVAQNDDEDEDRKSEKPQTAETDESPDKRKMSRTEVRKQYDNLVSEFTDKEKEQIDGHDLIENIEKFYILFMDLSSPNLMNENDDIVGNASVFLEIRNKKEALLDNLAALLVVKQENPHSFIDKGSVTETKKQAEELFDILFNKVRKIGDSRINFVPKNSVRSFKKKVLEAITYLFPVPSDPDQTQKPKSRRSNINTKTKQNQVQKEQKELQESLKRLQVLAGIIKG